MIVLRMFFAACPSVDIRQQRSKTREVGGGACHMTAIEVHFPIGMENIESVRNPESCFGKRVESRAVIG